MAQARAAAYKIRLMVITMTILGAAARRGVDGRHKIMMMQDVTMAQPLDAFAVLPYYYVLIQSCQ